MTPVSITALPTHKPTTEPNHRVWCCLRCNCFRRVSDSPVNLPQVQAIVDIADVAIKVSQCPPGPKIRAIERTDSVSDLRVRNLFEPRDYSAIDLWVFYPEKK